MKLSNQLGHKKLTTKVIGLAREEKIIQVTKNGQREEGIKERIVTQIRIPLI
jgi:hypothetical protein